MRFHFYGIAIFFIGTIVILNGCKKTESDVGIGLQPDSELLNITSIDTFTITSDTVRTDSVLTSNLSVFSLGRSVDPIFGYTGTSIYTQVLLSEENVDFGDVSKIKIDSVVLSLDYEGSYGNITNATFQVFELDEVLSSGTNYYSNSTFKVTNKLGERANYLPDVSVDSVRVGEIYEPAQLRINLDTSLGTRLINEAVLGGTNENFTTQFKGVYITTDSMTSLNNNYQLYVSLTSPFSRIMVYYHNDVDTLNFEFDISASSVRCGRYVHNYTGTVVENQLNDSTLGRNVFYVHALAGLDAKIDLVNIESFLEENSYAINKAILEIPVEGTIDDEFLPNEQLHLITKDSDGNKSYLIDSGQEYFDGRYSSTNANYQFNITRYLQAIASGANNNQSLFLIPRNGYSFDNSTITSNGFDKANQVSLKGNNSTEGIKLTISYTEL